MNGKFCTGKEFCCDGNMVSTQGHSQGHLATKSPTRSVDRRKCMNVCDVRSMGGAEILSDLLLVRAKIRLQIKRGEKTKKREIKLVN
jgi:hypothetical protein